VRQHRPALHPVAVRLDTRPQIKTGQSSGQRTRGFAPEQIAIADFNLDGRLDIASANYWDTTLSVFLGNGDGTFASPTAVTVGKLPAGITAADLNRDGVPDLAFASFGSDSLGVILSRCR
jgi:hypothetical protein